MAKDNLPKIKALGKIKSANKKKGSVDLKFAGLNFIGSQAERLSDWIESGDEVDVTIQLHQARLIS